VYFCTLYPSIGPKERSRQALDRLPLVSNFLTNFWMQHYDGARLSPNSFRNAVWPTLNEPVCQYLRKRNPRCSTVYIDNSLGPLARDSPCISLYSSHIYFRFFLIGTVSVKMLCLVVFRLQVGLPNKNPYFVYRQCQEFFVSSPKVHTNSGVHPGFHVVPTGI